MGFPVLFRSSGGGGEPPHVVIRQRMLAGMGLSLAALIALPLLAWLLP